MQTTRRRAVLGVVLAILALFAIIAAFWTPDTDREEMLTLYGGEQALWAETEDEGYHIHYRADGPADAQVLVLIHGTADSLHAWSEVVPALAQHYRVIRYDQPGHGLTGASPQRDYTFEGMAAGLRAVLRAEGVEQAVLIGNSMGGWVAWRMALAEPDLVTALVLLDPVGVATEEKAEGNLGFAIAQSPIGRWAMQRLTPRFVVHSSVRQSVAGGFEPDEGMTDRFHDLLRFPGNRQAAGDQFASPRQDLSSRLGEIEQPALIIWGAEDRLIPPAAGPVFTERMPNARLLVYEGVGHLPMNEAPERTASDILAFLDEALAQNPASRDMAP